MENFLSTSRSHPNVHTITPEMTLNPVASSASAPQAPPAPLPSPSGPANTPYDIFISHAGEDKVNIAFPLREKLRERGITCFVDKKDMPPGTEADQAMVHAMETATIGVAVLSPEFVARKWPMKEVMHFLTRHDQYKAAGINKPAIIPFFYRLSIQELYDEPRLDRKTKNGKYLYEESRIYQRQRNGEPEADIAGIKAALKKLHGIMGVENFVNANNDTGYTMSEKRNMILDKLCDKICEAVTGSKVESAVTEHARNADFDEFRPHFDEAYDVSELVFDFERRDSEGNVRTQEGKILEMLLSESMDRNRAIAVKGISGVGKTSLLRKIRSLETVHERFKDGVYFVEMGKDATQRGLKEALKSAVWNSGGKQKAKNMRAEMDMGEIMKAFHSWFAKKQCLFVIDDVWDTTEVTRAIIRHLWALHTSGRDSKTLLSTRSSEIATAGDGYFGLEPRESLEYESREILYHYGALKPEQGQEKDNKAVDDILKRCAGLPLFLNIAGKAVKTLTFRFGHKGCMAYRFHANQLQTSTGKMITTETESYEGLSARLKISIELVEERKEEFDFEASCSMAEMHRRLSVMKKQMRVPMSMLKHLWGLEDETKAATIAKEFEQVGLVDVGFEEEEERGVVAVLRLHDSVYEFAVYETEQWKEEEVGHKRVVEGYGKGMKRSGRNREWWSEDLKDDKYIHGNVCRHLVGAELVEELFGLLQSPNWLARQVELNGTVFAEGDFSIGIEATRSWKVNAAEGEGVEVEEALQMIGEAIRLSLSYVSRNPRELWFQVHGRLKRVGECNKLVREYIRRMESDARKPGVLCINGVLMEVGGANTRIVDVGSPIMCMVLLKDGERVACGSQDGDISIVNVRQSEIDWRWEAHDDWVTAIIVGKDGTRIVSGSRRTAKAWDVQSGGCVATFDVHSSYVKRIAITHDGKRVLTHTDLSEVQVWDTERPQKTGPSIKPDFNVWCFSMFRDGVHVVMEGENGKVEIWNITTNRKFGASFHGHMDKVTCAALTADESGLVTGSWDGTVRLWDVETRQQDGDLFEGHTDSVDSFEGHTVDWVGCVAISDDGHRFVSVLYLDKTIRVWDVRSRKQVCHPLIGHTDKITGVSFLTDSDTIVSCSEDGTIRLWDSKRNRNETTVDKHRLTVTGVCFTPNGRFVVSGSDDRTLRVWDAVSGQTVGEPFRVENAVNAVAITPDSRFVVSADHDGGLRLWDLQTHQAVRTFEGHTDFVECVAVTPDGECAVTGSYDKSVRIWDLKSTNESHSVLEGHSTVVNRVFVSDDGKRIISVDQDDNIFVWDINTQLVMRKTWKAFLWSMSKSKVLGLAGETTVHDEAGLSIPSFGNEIIHGEGSEACVLGTLDAAIHDWDISPDKQTVCVGLNDGRVGFLKLLS